MDVDADTEVPKKVSHVIYKENEEKKEYSLYKKDEHEPNDPFFIIHILCFLLGFMNIMPTMFFSTAQAYWMYKLRNTTISGDVTVGVDRTTLQSYYQSVSLTVSTIPSVLFTTLLTFYGHKIPAMFRLVHSTAALFGVFVVFTIFTQVNSDTWQTEFFVITMILLVIKSAFASILGMSSMVIVARLHHRFMFLFLLGQNGNFISTLLQILSLAVTETSVESGLLYFTVGTLTVLLTYVILIICRKSKFFQYYDVENVKEGKGETLHWSETKDVFILVWPSVMILIVVIFVATCTSPISTLVVSENDGDGSLWTTKYWIPVAVMLSMDLTSLMGRFLSKTLYITHSNKWFYIIASILRVLIVPFYIYSNAQPRTLPVIFDRDWQFLTCHIFNAITQGFLLNIAFMSVRPLAGEKQQGALKLLGFIMSLLMIVFTGNAIVIVKIL
ncbi:equilibrative nucleoside transporter 3-like [Diabrotica undecimpunctata]|uniref:equilibrative nucleoside transporter 3-like n=1 Tax=Diabrotica undecimpunctata TaxID=50387 RepID=UPI003B63CE78